jgi:hypothetical protein
VLRNTLEVRKASAPGTADARGAASAPTAAAPLSSMMLFQRRAAPNATADEPTQAASRDSVPASTCTPRSRSSGAVYSSGWWLTPPALGTKIMPTGTRRPMIIASW